MKPENEAILVERLGQIRDALLRIEDALNGLIYETFVGMETELDDEDSSSAERE